MQPTAPQPAKIMLPPNIPTVQKPKIAVPVPVRVTLPSQQGITNRPAVAKPQVPTMMKSTIQQPNALKVAGPHVQGGILKHFEGTGRNVGVVTVTPAPQTTVGPVINIVQETGYSILHQLMPIWKGTEEQILQLSQLKYENASPIIDVNRRDIIMEIIGMLRNQPFSDVIAFLTDAPNPEFILWDQKSMDEGRIRVIREINIQQSEEVGVKGVGKCKYCPSTELVFAQKQTRSGDEPMTVIVRCVMCQKQWRQ